MRHRRAPELMVKLCKMLFVEMFVKIATHEFIDYNNYCLAKYSPFLKLVNKSSIIAAFNVVKTKKFKKKGH